MLHVPMSMFTYVYQQLHGSILYSSIRYKHCEAYGANTHGIREDCYPRTRTADNTRLRTSYETTCPLL